MKKISFVLLALLLLAGCASKNVETVSDNYTPVPEKTMQQVYVALPEEAATPTMESLETGKLYLCDGYTLALQTMAAGDLQKTIQQVTGFSPEKLQIMQTMAGGVRRYDCVWAAAGEAEDQVARATILDDGNYHYAVTVMAPFSTAGDLASTWQAILSSVQLSTD